MARRRKRSIFSNLKTIFGNKNTPIGQLACSVCDHYIMGNSIYVIILGLIGTIITAFDIIRIINCKTSSRSPPQSRNNEVAIPLDVERDLKLMTSILGIEHYTLIVLGAITEYPMLHTPWLLMQLCVIIVDIIVFCVKIFLDGLHVKRDEILLSILTVHNWLQVEALYVALTCFITHCLSCVTLEAGGRSSFGKPVTKSAAFNSLFRRTYNLKIVILVTHIIAGVINTLLITIADKYGVPYLYLPWLINTMQGMTICEGPALVYLSNVLLPNITIPTALFTLISFILYAEEFFIWNDVFGKFLTCWKNYHSRKKIGTAKSNKNFTTIQKKRMHPKTEKINIGIEKIPIKFCNNINNRFSTPTNIQTTKSNVQNNSSFIQHQTVDMTGQ